MTSSPGYDFVIQLHHEVVCDVQTRAINTSLLTNLAVASPISRVIAQVIPPFQMKAHWDKPDLALADELLKLSANVRGGTRHVTKGINLTVEGTISAECRPRVSASRDGQPVVVLTAPSLWELDLADLDLSYKGDDEPLSWVDTTIEQTVLRPSFSLLLMAPLASLPLSYLPDSLPLRLKTTRTEVATEDLVLADSTVSLDSQAASLTLAMRCTARTPAPAGPADLLRRPTTANAAVAVSETGLNQVLGWLCARGLAAGTAQLGHGPIHWRWTHVAVTFTDDENVRLTGQLWHGATAIEVDAAMQCSLTASGQLSLQLTSPMPRPAEADLLIEATATLIRSVFAATLPPPRLASATQTTRGSAEQLFQRFLVPGTSISAEAPAVELVLRHGYLVALYKIPLDEQPLTLTIEEAKPKPTIDQPVIPSQTTPGTPVTAQLNARLANPIEPPYDYAWRVDHESRSRVDHGPLLTVTKTPPSAAPPVTATITPQKLATVSLKVIDILGQVGEVEVDATYYPAPSPQQPEPEPSPQSPQPQQERQTQTKAQRKRWETVGIFSGALLLLTAILAAVNFSQSSPPPPPPPPTIVGEWGNSIRVYAVGDTSFVGVVIRSIFAPVTGCTFVTGIEVWRPQGNTPHYTGTILWNEGSNGSNCRYRWSSSTTFDLINADTLRVCSIDAFPTGKHECDTWTRTG
ncbi:MAG: hypothetical protein M3460_26855 [Actinomycetota bacterium]|nr:hypothetical protein [Actinomycetota bacterium]